LQSAGELVELAATTTHERTMSDYLDCLQIDPEGDAWGTVIWMHGLGADASDFEPIVPLLDLTRPIRFVFPNAPVRPVTINAGMKMRAWYDIDPGAPLSGDAEIRESAASIEQLIEREGQRGIPPKRIVLAGFSQGGVVALHVALRYPERLAGVMGLSTFLMLADSLETERSASNQDIPIFLAHGSHDPVVGLNFGEWSRTRLEALGYQPEWHAYPMPHSVCIEEIADVRTWLVGLGAG
jgi:phospholipase/carboxylesterase